MIRLKMNAVGLNNLIKRIDKKRTKINKEIQNVFDDSSKNIYHRARALARVDTGQMRAHIKIRVTNRNNSMISILIYDDVKNRQGVNYSFFIEHGTIKMRAYPFLFPSLEYERPVLISRLRKALRKI